MGFSGSNGGIGKTFRRLNLLEIKGLLSDQGKRIENLNRKGNESKLERFN